MKKHLLFIAALIFAGFTFGQSTFQQVNNIIQSKCVTCHNSTSFSGGMDLSGSDSSVYANLVNKTPNNAKAVQLGYKRIEPGHPHRSFLLRKINNGLDADNGIGTGEGSAMPLSPNPSLSNYEIELVRQWVLAGAPKTGVVVDTSLIYTFYTVGGINSVPTPLAPPTSNGFQVHLGKIFLPPGKETEVFIKYNPKLTSAIEINRIELAQSSQSHHFVIYKYYSGQDAFFPDGYRDTSFTSHGSADILTAFSPQTTDHVLPPGTAYFVPQNSVFDLNYHLVNYSDTAVLAVEVYFNVYTQPQGTAQKYMFTRFFPELGIVIPPGDTTVFNVVAADTNETNMWDIWILYTHTHRFGLDYDVWKRNSDGTQGDMVYEGWFNFEYTFNQGFYDWGVEAPQRHFDTSFLSINPWEGLIHQAIFYNYSTDTAYFGLTSQDEMMVMGFQYTYGAPLNTPELAKEDFGLKVFPNPSNGKFSVSVNGENLNKKMVEATVFNILGEKVFYSTQFSLKDNSHVTLDLSEVPAGIYFLQMEVEGKSYAKKLMKQ